MTYGSVCSGIEAPGAAWPHWEAKWFAEIEPFPKAVLAHHYPDVPDLGDFTTERFMDHVRANPVDVFVGGTPCQGFSVAGLRKGMDDDRSNLALQFLRVIEQTRPTWVVWENVPGVFSTNGGGDFGAFIGGLEELGYGFAWRVLDAQYFGVPQRRRRVFLVGHSGGDWRPPAAVLFERESLQGDITPSRETRQGVARITEAGTGDASGFNFEMYSGETNGVAPARQALRAKDTLTYVSDARGNGDGVTRNAIVGDHGNSITDYTPVVALSSNSSQKGDVHEEVSPPVKVGSGVGIPSPPAVAIPINSMTAQGRPSDEGRMGSGIGEDGEPMNTLSSAHHHAVAFYSKGDGADVREEPVPPLRSGADTDDPKGHQSARTHAVGFIPKNSAKTRSVGEAEEQSPTLISDPPAVAFTQNQAGDVLTGDISPSMGCNSNASGRNTPKVATYWDGSQTAAPVDASNAKKQQTMPDKGRFQAVLEPARVIKTCNTKATGGNIKEEQSYALNQATAQQSAVFNPKAFVQNTRDEVRYQGGDGQQTGALSAEPGAKQQCYVQEPTSYTVSKNSNGFAWQGHVTPTIDSMTGSSGQNQQSGVVQYEEERSSGVMSVRRLTPL